MASTPLPHPPKRFPEPLLTLCMLQSYGRMARATLTVVKRGSIGGLPPRIQASKAQPGRIEDQFVSDRSNAAARPSATASPESVGTNRRAPSASAFTTIRPSSTRRATRPSFAASRSMP